MPTSWMCAALGTRASEIRQLQRLQAAAVADRWMALRLRVLSAVSINLLGVCLTFSLVAPGLCQDPAVFNALPSWHDDADLHDITFVDGDYGWAVGDHGTIWHTRNGGEIWRRQATPSPAPLQSVHFVDRWNGWAVGGMSVPLTQMTQGVLWQTNDGGITWSEIPGLLLPWLNRVHFTSTQHGIAVGHASSQYPTGVWTTNDGGRTWSPVPGERGIHWVAAEFVPTSPANRSSKQDFVGLLRGHDGRIGRVSNGRVTTVTPPTTGWHRHTAVSMPTRDISFAGLAGLSVSGDGGRTWQPIGRFHPNRIQQQMQWHSFVHHGQQMWAAGTPGNRILSSSDFGQTWHSTVTPATLPIRQLHFSSPQRGWGAGAKGTILSTKDGGQTWSLQRGGLKRDALLGVFADERDIPWHLIAQASAVDEFRTHIVLLSLASDSRRSWVGQRLHDAAMQLGATVEILTPAQTNTDVNLPAEEILRRWQGDHSNAVAWLSERLTRTIRERRPDIVLTSSIGNDAQQTGAQRLTARLIADACDYAETDQAFPAQLLDFGLVPWHVSRVLACVTKSGSASLPKSKRKSGLGHSVEELAKRAYQIVNTTAGPRSWTLQSLRDEDAGELGTLPFAGLAVEYGSSSRRERAAPIALQLDRGDIAVAMARNGTQGMQRIEQIESLVANPLAAGRILFDLASNESDANERDLLLRELVTRHPKHPLAFSSVFQLVEHHTSLERKWRSHRQNPTPRATLLTDVETQPASANPTVQQASATTEFFKPDWTIGHRLLQEIQSKQPMLSVEPEIAFPLATIPRQTKAHPKNSPLKHQMFPNGWPAYAKLELLLTGSDHTTAKQQAIWACQAVTTKPHLDGDLSDETWQSAEFRELKVSNRGHHQEQNTAPTLVGMAKDSEYLYLAAYCPKRQNFDYDPIRKNRPRDADLSKHDRIRIRLDINRDYTSWWTFSFDDRGWTNDALNEDLDWDPKYYVATKSDERVWAIEAAIPLEELSPVENSASTYWAIGVERIVPESSVERWNPGSTLDASADLQGLLHLP